MKTKVDMKKLINSLDNEKPQEMIVKLPRKESSSSRGR